MSYFRIHHNWPKMDDLRGELERMFAEVANPADGCGNALHAPLEITEDADRYFVRLELPGVDPKDVEVLFQDGALTVRGEKKPAEGAGGMKVHRTERHWGAFQRTATLPGAIDSEKIGAEFNQGVLTVTLPKREDSKPRTIVIKPTGK